ncbi:Cyclin-D3-1 [Camellia lanceoleosa]|uniref:Cyclin-D3-1 n=1 Tax=Camellia lanceoleosa TaxID=1840588 RepID=A0ACC0HUK9_9ERIC|nr:Cyclin-D3-1 [Camellia lanceoleosa]
MNTDPILFFPEEDGSTPTPTPTPTTATKSSICFRCSVLPRTTFGGRRDRGLLDSEEEDYEELTSLFSKEQENPLFHSLETDPSLGGARRAAVEWLLKVNAHYSFSALTAVLAVNYLDRFLFSFHFRREKPWMTQLAAVACLSLAAKVEETEVPPY